MSGNGQITQLFDSLPNEMLLGIFSHCTSVTDRLVFSQVSKRFKNLVEGELWRKRLVVKFTDFTGKYSDWLCTPVSNSNNLLVQEAMKSMNLECLEIQTRYRLINNRRISSEVLQFYKDLRDFLTLFFKFFKKLKSVKCTIMERGNVISAVFRPYELFLHSPPKCASLLSECPLPFKNIEIASIHDCHELTHILTVSKEIVEQLSIRQLVLTDNMLAVIEQCKKLRIVFPLTHVTISNGGYNIMYEASFLYLQNMEESFGKMILRNNSLLSTFFSRDVNEITIRYSDFYSIFKNMLDHCTNLVHLNVNKIYVNRGMVSKFRNFLDEVLNKMSHHDNVSILRLTYNYSPIILNEQYLNDRYSRRFTCKRDLDEIDTFLIRKV